MQSLCELGLKAGQPCRVSVVRNVGVLDHKRDCSALADCPVVVVRVYVGVYVARSGEQKHRADYLRAKAVIDGVKAARVPRFVKTTGNSRSLDHSALARARRVAGLKGYVTNIPASVMDAPEVASSYHLLWHVEQSFRMSKTDLAARPMFARHGREDDPPSGTRCCGVKWNVSQSLSPACRVTSRSRAASHCRGPARSARSAADIINGTCSGGIHSSRTTRMAAVARMEGTATSA